MATIPVNPILKHPTNLLVNSGQIDATKKRLDFDPSEKRKDLRFKKPVENESGERVAARFMTAAMEGMGSLQLERIIKGNDLMSVKYFTRYKQCALGCTRYRSRRRGATQGLWHRVHDLAASADDEQSRARV